MSEDILHLFADITAKLEDLHAVAVEGMRPDNAADMHAALIGHLRLGVAALDASMRGLATPLRGSAP